MKYIPNNYAQSFIYRSVVKSIGLFVLGVKIAVECKGMNVMPPIS